MAKIDINRVELVWPGKYNEDGSRREVPRARLPFQVIETINESRATREAAKAPLQHNLFDIYAGTEGDTFADGWRNKLIWGDNLLVMGSLLEKFAGKIDLIYIDPPFATGADFSVVTEIGDNLEVTKEQSIIEEKAYRDTWGRGLGSYLSMMYQRLELIRDLLSPSGSVYVHCDWRMNSALRVVLDELFGVERFGGEIKWKRVVSTGSSKSISKKYPVVDDSILFYTKSTSYTWNSLFTEYSEEYKKRFNQRDNRGLYYWDNLKSYSREMLERLIADDRIRLPLVEGRNPRVKNYLHEGKGVVIDNLWIDVIPVNSQAAEDTGYATQKPESLLERIIKASSNEGDLVADFFCGSGTTLAVAEKLGRRWIGADLGRFAVHTARKRLLSIEGSKPFEILNLGRYERQYWQGVSFGQGGKVSEQALYEYLAFILKLYGAQPVAGMQHLHGKKGAALVYIGAVDAPVTIDEATTALDECARLKQKELHILGWEWEMGMSGMMEGEAKRRGMKLFLLQIPREVMEQQAVDKGDIRFFGLAYLQAETTISKRSVSVKLSDFVIPNTELIPEEVRAKVRKWSDYIDYWAVDWNFQNDTFMQGWVAYRTRKDRTLVLEADPYTYPAAGRYRLLIKVVDIFGNDTTQEFPIEIG
ncbi:MAG: site-specific DNA-methyltransferase [Chloroflexales bacterium]